MPDAGTEDQNAVDYLEIVYRKRTLPQLEIKENLGEMTSKFKCLPRAPKNQHTHCFQTIIKNICAVA